MTHVTRTANFNYDYADGLNAADKAAAIAHINALVSTCESDLAVLDSFFGISGEFAGNLLTISIENLQNAQGENYGYYTADEVGSNRIDITPFTGAPDGDAATRALFVAELAEVLMSYRNKNTGIDTWGRGNSMGEGLSLVCSAVVHPEGYYTATVNGGMYGVSIDQWLNSSTRPDWVTHNESTDGNAVSYGCAILFIYYLQSQLGFSFHDIITRAGHTLAQTYTNLTQEADGWTPFITALNAHFPVGGDFNPTSDNLFPFPELATFKAPSKIICGYSAMTYLSIDRTANAEVIVNLTSADPMLVSVPATVTISPKSTIASILVQTTAQLLPFAPRSVNVQASYAGTTLTIQVEVVSPGVANLTVNPGAVICGNGSTGTVTLNLPSKNGSVMVNLISGSPGFATVPAQLTIPQDQPSGTFPIMTPTIQIPFPTAHVEIWAEYASTAAYATLTVEPKIIVGILDSLTISPAMVHGGSVTRGRVALVQAVPTDTLVGLAAVEPGTHIPRPGSESSIASTPPSVTIHAGEIGADFLITTRTVLPSTRHEATIVAGAVVTKYAVLTIEG